MRGGAGIALVAVGIILLWMAITGKLDCLSQFVSCVFGTTPTSLASNTSNTGTTKSGSGIDVSTFVNNLPGIINFANGIAGSNQPQTSSPFVGGQRI